MAAPMQRPNHLQVLHLCSKHSPPALQEAETSMRLEAASASTSLFDQSELHHGGSDAKAKPPLSASSVQQALCTRTARGRDDNAP